MDNLLKKEESHKIIGEIYKITNLITNKMYIGQTRSHYLNNGKYRPFGHIGRFKSHISESKYIDKHYSFVEEYMDFLNMEYIPDIYDEDVVPIADMKEKLLYSKVLVDIVHYFASSVIDSNA